jgi:hypothetical protein
VLYDQPAKLFAHSSFGTGCGAPFYFFVSGTHRWEKLGVIVLENAKGTKTVYSFSSVDI